MRYLNIAMLMAGVFLITSACAPKRGLLASGPDFGSFSGPVRTEWNDPEGREMKVLETVTYTDPNGTTWEAPEGWIVNGSSIPRVFWTIVASPYVGNHRNASVFHDVACDQKEAPWENVHTMYYNACRLGGVSQSKAKLMFAAVWMGGPRWETPSEATEVPDEPTTDTLKVTVGKLSFAMVKAHQEDVEASQQARLVAVERAIENNENISLEEIIQLVE